MTAGNKLRVGISNAGYDGFYEIDGTVISSSLSQHPGGMCSADFTVATSRDGLKQILDDMDDFTRPPLAPCTWCGSWKARRMNCPKCGAPEEL